MMFKTQYDNRAPVYACSGSPIVEDFIGHYDADGVLRLEKSGETDLYEKIQSYKDSVDLNVIVKRYLAGDTEVLNRIQGTYADCTTMPKTYAEVLNLSIRAEQDFLRLPDEIRAKFGNDPVQFISQMGSEEWHKKLGFESEKPVEPEKISKEDSAE